jgi:hypothetical protein
MNPGRGSTPRETDWLGVSCNVTLTLTLQISLCYSTHKVFKSQLNLHRLTACTLLQLRTSHGCLLPRTDSSLNRTNSVTYIVEERTRVTGNTCHVTATHRCVTSPRTRKTQPPLLLRVGPCLQGCCLATRWSNPLQYKAFICFGQWWSSSEYQCFNPPKITGGRNTREALHLKCWSPSDDGHPWPKLVKALFLLKNVFNLMKFNPNFKCEYDCHRPPLCFSGQCSWLQVQRSRVRFPALPDFLRSSESGTGSAQPREDNWGATWKKSSGSDLENRKLTVGIRCADHATPSSR